MDDIRNRVRQLSRGKPIGAITPRSDRLGTDEAGRVYEYASLEEREQRRKHAYYKRDKRHFTFTHMKHIKEISETLTNKYCGYVLMMQPHIQFKTNILVKPGREEIPLNINGIAEVLGVQRRGAKETIRKLIEAGILKEMSNERFSINERYHFRKKAGADIDMLVKTFHTKVKELDLKPAEMGIIYKLLPYVHYESNLVCADPFEDDARNVQFLNKTQISKLVGISRQKTDEVLRKLTSAGAIATIQRKSGLVPQNSGGDGRETVVLINPSIITRIKGEPNVTIRQIFGE